MQAIEMPVVEINHQQQIHLQLSHTVRARKAKVIVIYDEPEQSTDTLTLASFLNELPDVPTGMGVSREDIAQHIDNERQSWDHPLHCQEKKLAYLYQHAETRVMNVFREYQES